MEQDATPTPHDAKGQERRDTLQKQRLEYWTKRLDHTLTHTQSSSQLIYLVDGAVLALLAFIIEKLRPPSIGIALSSIPICLLALFNYYHASLIKHQHAWYTAINDRLLELLGNEDKVSPEPSEFGGTHDIYRRMHIVIAAFLALSAIGIACYALFPFYFH